MQGIRIPAIRYADLIAHLRTPLYRNGYFLIASTGITSALGLVYWALAARMYETDAVGLNSAAISVMIFLSGIAQLNLQEAMVRYVPLTGKRTARFVVYSYLIVLALSALVGAIFCLGIFLWSPKLSFINAEPSFTLWFIFAVMLWGVFVVEDAVLTGLRQTMWVPIENAVFSVAKIAFLALFALSVPGTGIFTSWAAAVLLVMIPINYLIFRRLIPQHVRSAREGGEPISIRQITTYVAGNYVAALLVNVSTALLPLIITQFAGAVANAHFYLAWIIAYSLQVISSNMATSFTVEGVINKEKLAVYKWRVTFNILRLVVPLVVLLIIAAPFILRLMGNSYADDGVLLMRLLALSAVPNVINTVYVALARVRSNVRTVIYIYGANAVLVLGLSAVLLGPLGITGVGLAWLISQTIIAIAVLSNDILTSLRTTARGSLTNE